MPYPFKTWLRCVLILWLTYYSRVIRYKILNIETVAFSYQPIFYPSYLVSFFRPALFHTYPFSSSNFCKTLLSGSNVYKPYIGGYSSDLTRPYVSRSIASNARSPFSTKTIWAPAVFETFDRASKT